MSLFDEEVFDDPLAETKKEASSDPYFDDVSIDPPAQQPAQPAQPAAPLSAGPTEALFRPTPAGPSPYSSDSFESLGSFSSTPAVSPKSNAFYQDWADFKDHYGRVTTDLTDLTARNSASSERLDHFFDNKVSDAYSSMLGGEPQSTTRDKRHEILDDLTRQLDDYEARIAEGDTAWFGEDEAYEEAKAFATPENVKYIRGLKGEHDRLVAESKDYEERKYRKKQEKDALLAWKMSIPHAIREAGDEWEKEQKAMANRKPPSMKKVNEALDSIGFDTDPDYEFGYVLNIDQLDPRISLDERATDAAVAAQSARFQQAKTGLMDELIAKQSGEYAENDALRKSGFIAPSWKGIYNGHPLGITASERELLDLDKLKKLGLTAYKGKPIDEALRELGGEEKVTSLRAASAALKAHNAASEAAIKYFAAIGKPEGKNLKAAWEILDKAADQAVGNAFALGFARDTARRGESGGWWERMGNAIKNGWDDNGQLAVFDELLESGEIDETMSRRLADAFNDGDVHDEKLQKFVEELNGKKGWFKTVGHAIENYEELAIVGAQSMSMMFSQGTYQAQKALPYIAGIGAAASYFFHRNPRLSQIIFKALSKVSVGGIVPKSALGAGVGGALSAAQETFFFSSMALEQNGVIMEELMGLGVDIHNPRELLAAWNNESIREKIKLKGKQRGYPIWAMDRLGAFMLTKGAGAVASSMRKSAYGGGRAFKLATGTVATGAGYLAADAAAGATGEYLAQVLANEPGEEIRKGDIVLEGMAEFTGPQSVIKGGGAAFKSLGRALFPTKPSPIASDPGVREVTPAEPHPASPGALRQTITVEGQSKEAYRVRDVSGFQAIRSDMESAGHAYDEKEWEAVNTFADRVIFNNPNSRANPDNIFFVLDDSTGPGSPAKFTRSGEKMIFSLNPNLITGGQFGLAETFIHEGNHFAEDFILDEGVLENAWNSLSDDQRNNARLEYASIGRRGGPVRSADDLTEVERNVYNNLGSDEKLARSEWLALQISRVLRGELTKEGMSSTKEGAALWRGIQDIIDIFRDVVARLFGAEGLSPKNKEEFDDYILSKLLPSPEEGGTTSPAPPAPAPAPVDTATPPAPAEAKGTPLTPEALGQIEKFVKKGIADEKILKHAAAYDPAEVKEAIKKFKSEVEKPKTPEDVGKEAAEAEPKAAKPKVKAKVKKPEEEPKGPKPKPHASGSSRRNPVNKPLTKGARHTIGIQVRKGIDDEKILQNAKRFNQDEVKEAIAEAKEAHKNRPKRVAPNVSNLPEGPNGQDVLNDIADKFGRIKTQGKGTSYDTINPVLNQGAAMRLRGGENGVEPDVVADGLNMTVDELADAIHEAVEQRTSGLSEQDKYEAKVEAEERAKLAEEEKAKAEAEAAKPKAKKPEPKVEAPKSKVEAEAPKPKKKYKYVDAKDTVEYEEWSPYSQVDYDAEAEYAEEYGTDVTTFQAHYLDLKNEGFGWEKDKLEGNSEGQTAMDATIAHFKNAQKEAPKPKVEDEAKKKELFDLAVSKWALEDYKRNKRLTEMGEGKQPLGVYINPDYDNSELHWDNGIVLKEKDGTHITWYPEKSLKREEAPKPKPKPKVEAPKAEVEVSEGTVVTDGTYSGLVTELAPHQVFVFGSNPEGRHGKGSALKARQWGAEYGNGKGPQGQTYAIPTKDLRVKKDKGFKSIPEKDIIDSLGEFYEYAEANPDKQFLVADWSGKNLNGYSGEEMAGMFAGVFDVYGSLPPGNVVFSKNFHSLLKDKMEIVTNRDVEAPKAKEEKPTDLGKAEIQIPKAELQELMDGGMSKADAIAQLKKKYAGEAKVTLTTDSSPGPEKELRKDSVYNQFLNIARLTPTFAADYYDAIKALPIQFNYDVTPERALELFKEDVSKVMTGTATTRSAPITEIQPTKPLLTMSDAYGYGPFEVPANLDYGSINRESPILKNREGFTPNDGQSFALNDIYHKVLNGASDMYVIAGYAGTGKSSIVESIVRQFDLEDVKSDLMSGGEGIKRKFVWTGPMHNVLNIGRTKLKNGELDEFTNIDFNAATTHSAFLLREKDEKTGVYKTTGPGLSPQMNDWVSEGRRSGKRTVIIMDETGMVDDEQIRGAEMAREAGAILIFLGDPGQLGPIAPSGRGGRKGEGRELNNPLLNPNITLTEIMRSEKGNDLLEYVTALRSMPKTDRIVAYPTEDMENVKVYGRDQLKKARALFSGMIQKAADSVMWLTYSNKDRDIANQTARLALSGNPKARASRDALHTPLRDGERLMVLNNAEGRMEISHGDGTSHTDAIREVFSNGSLAKVSDIREVFTLKDKEGRASADYGTLVNKMLTRGGTNVNKAQVHASFYKVTLTLLSDKDQIARDILLVLTPENSNQFVRDYHTQKMKSSALTSPYTGDWSLDPYAHKLAEGASTPALVDENGPNMTGLNARQVFNFNTAEGLNEFFEENDSGKMVLKPSVIMATYGYASTIHKSQGQEFENVFVTPPRPIPYEESYDGKVTYEASNFSPEPDFDNFFHKALNNIWRILYTAGTRGRNSLHLIKPSTAGLEQLTNARGAYFAKRKGNEPRIPALYEWTPAQIKARAKAATSLDEFNKTTGLKKSASHEEGFVARRTSKRPPPGTRYAPLTEYEGPWSRNRESTEPVTHADKTKFLLHLHALAGGIKAGDAAGPDVFNYEKFAKAASKFFWEHATDGKFMLYDPRRNQMQVQQMSYGPQISLVPGEGLKSLRDVSALPEVAYFENLIKKEKKKLEDVKEGGAKSKRGSKEYTTRELVAKRIEGHEAALEKYKSPEYLFGKSFRSLMAALLDPEFSHQQLPDFSNTKAQQGLVNEIFGRSPLLPGQARTENPWVSAAPRLLTDPSFENSNLQRQDLRNHIKAELTDRQMVLRRQKAIQSALLDLRTRLRTREGGDALSAESTHEDLINLGVINASTPGVGPGAILAQMQGDTLSDSVDPTPGKKVSVDSPEEFHLYSGGAVGSDDYMGAVASAYGIDVTHFTESEEAIAEKASVAGKKIFRNTEVRGDGKPLGALKRIYGIASEFFTGFYGMDRAWDPNPITVALKKRNFFQVFPEGEKSKKPHQVIAVVQKFGEVNKDLNEWLNTKWTNRHRADGAVDLDSFPTGGTAYAVFYALNAYYNPTVAFRREDPVEINVFDESSGEWMRFDYATSKFEVSTRPYVTRGTNTAVIGTRGNRVATEGGEARHLQIDSKLEIEGVFAQSFPQEFADLYENQKTLITLDNGELRVVTPEGAQPLESEIARLRKALDRLDGIPYTYFSKEVEGYLREAAGGNLLIKSDEVTPYLSATTNHLALEKFEESFSLRGLTVERGLPKKVFGKNWAQVISEVQKKLKIWNQEPTLLQILSVSSYKKLPWLMKTSLAKDLEKVKKSREYWDVERRDLESKHKSKWRRNTGEAKVEQELPALDFAIAAIESNQKLIDEVISTYENPDKPGEVDTQLLRRHVEKDDLAQNVYAKILTKMFGAFLGYDSSTGKMDAIPEGADADRLRSYLSQDSIGFTATGARAKASLFGKKPQELMHRDDMDIRYAEEAFKRVRELAGHNGIVHYDDFAFVDPEGFNPSTDAPVEKDTNTGALSGAGHSLTKEEAQKEVAERNKYENITALGEWSRELQASRHGDLGTLTPAQFDKLFNHELINFGRFYEMVKLPGKEDRYQVREAFKVWDHGESTNEVNELYEHWKGLKEADRVKALEEVFHLKSKVKGMTIEFNVREKLENEPGVYSREGLEKEAKKIAKLEQMLSKELQKKWDELNKLRSKLADAESDLAYDNIQKSGTEESLKKRSPKSKANIKGLKSQVAALEEVLGETKPWETPGLSKEEQARLKKAYDPKRMESASAVQELEGGTVKSSYEVNPEIRDAYFKGWANRMRRREERERVKTWNKFLRILLNSVPDRYRNETDFDLDLIRHVYMVGGEDGVKSLLHGAVEGSDLYRFQEAFNKSRRRRLGDHASQPHEGAEGASLQDPDLKERKKETDKANEETLVALSTAIDERQVADHLNEGYFEALGISSRNPDKILDKRYYLTDLGSEGSSSKPVKWDKSSNSKAVERFNKAFVALAKASPGEGGRMAVQAVEDTRRHVENVRQWEDEKWDHVHTASPFAEFNTLEDLESEAAAIIKSKKGDHKYVFIRGDKSVKRLMNSVSPDTKEGKRVKGGSYHGIGIVSDFYQHNDIKDSTGDPADIIIVDNISEAQEQYKQYKRGGAKDFVAIVPNMRDFPMPERPKDTATRRVWEKDRMGQEVTPPEQLKAYSDAMAAWKKSDKKGPMPEKEDFEATETVDFPDFAPESSNLQRLRDEYYAAERGIDGLNEEQGFFITPRLLAMSIWNSGESVARQVNPDHKKDPKGNYFKHFLEHGLDSFDSDEAVTTFLEKDLFAVPRNPDSEDFGDHFTIQILAKQFLERNPDVTHEQIREHFNRHLKGASHVDFVKYVKKNGDYKALKDHWDMIDSERRDARFKMGSLSANTLIVNDGGITRRVRMSNLPGDMIAEMVMEFWRNHPNPEDLMLKLLVEPSLRRPKEMSYTMSAKDSIYKKKVRTAELMNQGLRTATTRFEALGKPGDLITFDGVDGLWVVVSDRKITKELINDPDFREEWSKLEGWTPEWMQKGGFIKPGMTQTIVRKAKGLELFRNKGDSSSDLRDGDFNQAKLQLALMHLYNHSGKTALQDLNEVEYEGVDLKTTSLDALGNSDLVDKIVAGEAFGDIAEVAESTEDAPMDSTGPDMNEYQEDFFSERDAPLSEQVAQTKGLWDKFLAWLSSPFDLDRISEKFLKNRDFRNDRAGKLLHGAWKGIVNSYYELDQLADVLTEDIRKSGARFTQNQLDGMNVAQKLRLYYGQTGKELDDAKSTYEARFNELLTSLNDEEPLRLVGEYWYARYAETRNKNIQKLLKRSGMPLRDNYGKEYGSGMTSDVANSIIAKVEGRSDFAQIQALTKIFEKMNMETLSNLVEGEVLPESEANSIIRNAIRHNNTTNKTEWVWAPLRGFEKDYSDHYPTGLDGIRDAAGYEALQGEGTGSGFTQKPDSTYTLTGAFGRTTLADSQAILGNALRSHAESIVRKNKNKGVAQAMLKMLAEVADNPELYGKWKHLFKIHNPNDADFKKSWPSKKVPYKAVDASGKETVMVKEIQYNPLEDDKNFFVVRVKGNPIYIEFRGAVGERLVSALKNRDVHAPIPLMQHWSEMTSFFAALYTVYNVSFMITNFMRDVVSASLNLSGDRDTRDINRKIFNLKSLGTNIKAMMQVANARSNKLPTDKLLKNSKLFEKVFADYQKGPDFVDRSELETLISDPIASALLMQKAGGQVEFFGIEDVEKKTRQLINDLKKAQETNRPIGHKKGLFKLFEYIKDINTGVENAVRMEAFKLMLLDGKSLDIAAMKGGRESTVDFNRGGDFKSTLNALYPFFGAGISANSRLVRSLFKDRDPGAGWKLAMKIAGAAFMYNMLMRMWAGEDDETEEKHYDRLSGWSKRHQLNIFPKPGGDGGHFALPLPYGWNLFWGVGSDMADMAASGTGMSDRDFNPAGVAANTLGSVIDTFHPMSGGDGLMRIIPHAPRVGFELAFNENFLGNPIIPENPTWGLEKPRSQRYWKNTSPLSIKLAETINSATGGDEFESGAIDFSPGQLDHVLSYFGGTFGKQVWGLTGEGYRKATTGRADGRLVWKNTPLASTLWKPETNDFGTQKGFMNVEKQVNTNKTRVRKLTERGDRTEALAAKKKGAKLAAVERLITAHNSRKQFMARKIANLRRQKVDEGKIQRLEERLDKEKIKGMAEIVRKARKLGISVNEYD